MLMEACAFFAVLRVFCTGGHQKGAGLSFLAKEWGKNRKMIAFSEEMSYYLMVGLLSSLEYSHYSQPMTQAKTLARLFKSAASTSLALSALAGGVMLSGGEAKALISTVCVPPSGQLPAECTTSGDSYVGVPFTNKADGTLPINPGGSVFVNLEATGLGGPFSQQQIDTDFNGPLLASATSVYTVVTDIKTPFNQVDLSWVQVPGAPGNVSAEYVLYSAGTIIDTKLLNINGSLAAFNYPSTPIDKIVVTNTYTPGGGAIDNAQNTFRNVPGPLPILGAGAAFGFSRKLRGRIKAARTA